MAQVPIDRLIAELQAGGCLASFPTDTVPALASRPEDAALIFVAKHRSPRKPLILMAADPADIWAYVVGRPDEQERWRQVAQDHWPGMVTLVLPVSDRVPHAMHPTELDTLGFRIPNCAIAREILSQTGPLATTSVNVSGQQPLTTLEAINQQFPDVLTLSADELAQRQLTYGGNGQPSSVVKWNGQGWTVLRQGSVTFAE
ncbi:MAG: L-threonylcarbamoyladenylate synthase [Elainellaceae cyanobacterium]